MKESREKTKILHISFTMQEKIEWDELLTKAQREAGKTLTIKDFFLIVMECYKKKI